jgi:hypothetical protein
MANPKKDAPWWTNKNELWGGETFTAKDDATDIEIVVGDKYRVEVGSNNKPYLIPHVDNVGKWKDTHSKTNTVKMTSVTDPRYLKTYRMMVHITATSGPKELFFILQINGVTCITDDIDDPGSDDGCATIER